MSVTIAAEKSVLGCLIDCPEMIPAVIQTGIERDDFSFSEYGIAWDHLRKMSLEQQPISLTLLWDRMGGDKNTAAMLGDLTFGCVAVERRVLSLVQIILKYSQIRACGRLGDCLMAQSRDPYADPGQIIAQAAATLMQVGGAV